MKTTSTIIAAVLSLSMNVLFASNDRISVNSEPNSFQASLAPAAPVEATFEEMNEAPASIVIPSPVTPTEAVFSDAVPNAMIDISTLAPATPDEADFDSEEIQIVNAIAFAPVTPAAADFSDGI